jgi:hypothetical protein
MKHTLTFCILLGIKLSAQAQYIPLVEENKYWIHLSAYDIDHPKVSGAYLITFEGDTLIAGQQYKNVWNKHLKGSHPCPPWLQPCFTPDLPYTTTISTLIGFIREDIATQKVYFLPNEAGFCQNQVYELFDFSAMQGDTLNECTRTAINAIGSPGLGIVDSVTTEYLFGKNRKVLSTTGQVTYGGLGYFGRLGICEGLGFGTYGLFHYYLNLDDLYDFCEGNCNILSSISDLSQEASISIYPNPTTDEIKIDTELEIEQVYLIDLYGRKTGLFLSQNTLNMQHLAPGIYTLSIQFSSGHTMVKSLVKL